MFKKSDSYHTFSFCICYTIVGDIMKIQKYKKKRNGQYELHLDSHRDFCLYEDVILKFELLFKGTIEQDELDKILIYNQECDVYYVALKSLKNRFKSISELRKSLLKKQYPQEYVEKAIEKLLAQGYLNDRNFAKAYINQQMITTLKGPEKIKKELLDKGVLSDIVVEELDAFKIEDQIMRIEKIANRLIKSNKSRGGVVLQKKVVYDLQNLGYSLSHINEVLSYLDFGDTRAIAKKEKDKLYRRFSKKYSGKELENKIKERLYQKGLYYED